MKKVILAFSFSVIASVFAVAENTDDHKKVEIFTGYSNGQVDTGLDSGSSAVDFFRDRENFNGFNVSGVYNLSRYFGIKGDVSGTFRNSRTTFSADTGGTPLTISFKDNSSLYNFVGGVQLKDNSREGRFKPFAHAMVGAAHARTKISDYSCQPSTSAVCTGIVFPDNTFTNTGLAGLFGGGIDIKVTRRIQIRAIQVDYNPIRMGGQFDHNARIGAGIVF